MYIGYDLEGGKFIDEQGKEVKEEIVRQLLNNGRLDATAMAYRAVTQFDCDADGLRAFYSEHP